MVWSRSDKCGAHNLLKPSMYELDQGKGYSVYVGGYTRVEVRLYLC